MERSSISGECWLPHQFIRVWLHGILKLYKLPYALDLLMWGHPFGSEGFKHLFEGLPIAAVKANSRVSSFCCSDEMQGALAFAARK